MTRTKTDDPLYEAAHRGKHMASACKMLDLYEDDEREFLTAVQAYRVRYNRPHPTVCEYLAILKSLRWVKEG